MGTVLTFTPRLKQIAPEIPEPLDGARHDADVC